MTTHIHVDSICISCLDRVAQVDDDQLCTSCAELNGSMNGTLLRLLRPEIMVEQPSIDDVLDDLAAEVFAKGQDHKPGDGSATQVGDVVERAKKKIAEMVVALVIIAVREGMSKS